MVRFVTDFGDLAVILPLIVAIGLVLLAQGWQRGAIAWALATTLTLGIMLLLKLVFIACWHHFWGIYSPSGHVAAATIVAGGLACLLLRRRLMVATVSLLAAVIIGLTRIALGAHSPPEVVLGAIVGVSGALALTWMAGQSMPQINLRPMLFAIVMVLVIFHGWHMPAEAHIHNFAKRLAHILPAAACD